VKEKMPNNSWPLMSEVVGRENVNKKMSNNLTNANEKMPNNHDDSVIYYERLLADFVERHKQVNLESETARTMIAKEIAKEKTPNNMTDKANNLLDQIILAAQQDDEHLKEYWLCSGQGQKTIGDSFVVFHLKILKKLLNE